MGDGTKDEEVPIGSTKESLGKIDFDAGVPLDRDEEISRKLGSLKGAGDEPPGISALDLLFRTRLADLKPQDPVSVPAGSTVAAACAVMREHDTGAVLVLDGEKLAGIFTARDVVEKCMAAGAAFDRMKVDDLMNMSPPTVGPTHRIVHAINAMTRDRCLEVPLLDQAGRAVGLVSARRIVDFLTEQFPQKLLNLPPDPDQAMPRREGG